MYIKDGSKTNYNSNQEEENSYSWGWLGDKVESSSWASILMKKRGYRKT